MLTKKAMRRSSFWWRSSSQSTGSSEGKERKKQAKFENVSRQFHHLGLLVRDKRETWHKSCKKKQHELVTLSEELCSDLFE